MSLGRPRACHKSKIHHHYLEAIQLAREAAFAHWFPLQKKKQKLQAEFVLLDRHCKLRMRLMVTALNTVSDYFLLPLKLSGKSLPPDLKKNPSHVSDFLARRAFPFMFYGEHVRHIASKGKFSSHKQKASSWNRWQSEQSYVWVAHVPALGSLNYTYPKHLHCFA